MRRRRFLAGGATLAAGALGPRAGSGQTPAKPFRVGFVTIAGSAHSLQSIEFAKRFRELGYVEGKDLVIDPVFLNGRADGYALAMKEVVARGADAVLANGPEVALKAALAASPTVPIVMLAFDYDPLALGYVKSLARPGGNITGLFTQQIDLAVKRAQLIKQVLPDLAGAAMFWDGPSRDQWQATEKAARTLGFSVTAIDMAGLAYDYVKAMTGIPHDHRGALLVPNSPVFFNDRTRLADVALQQRLPAMFPLREFVAAGGLISYGPNFVDIVRRLADYFDRINRGAKPADLPIEQPTRFELVINLKTAKAIGVDIPPTVLVRADEVIE